MRHLNSTIWLLGLALGCRPDPSEADTDSTPAVEPGPPAIAVAPERIEFDEVEVDGAGASEAEIVQIVNTGESPLILQPLTLEGGDDGVFTLGELPSTVLDPGGSTPFVVSFIPLTAGELSDTVLIASNDPALPVLELPLSGLGLAPVLSQEAVDLGGTWVGCTTSAPHTLSNLGNLPLEISALSLDDDTSTLTVDTAEADNGPLPWTLDPGEEVEVSLVYAPLAPGTHAATLTVSSSDPVSTEATATVRGEAEAWAERTDTWTILPAATPDILVAVDRSISPTSYIDAHTEHADTLVDELVAKEADFQLAFIVEDSGCINGSDLFIDETFDSSDAPAIVEDMINWGGSYGSNSERPFMLLEAALDKAQAGGCNEGLVRETASLHLVLVSDEPEQSVNAYSYYVSLFQSMKADPADVVIHAIGGDYPGGCYSASAFTGAYEATVATGGAFLSICSADTEGTYEELAEAIAAWVSPRSFELFDWPVEGTLTVLVDGEPLTEGWSYSEADNAVVFEEGAEPPDGATVEITYTLAGPCES